jgi:hypothetical protein
MEHPCASLSKQQTPVQRRASGLSCIDGCVLNEYIGPIIWFNEAKSFFVKPFYSSLRHGVTLLSKYYHGSQLRVATMTNGSYAQIKSGLLIMVKLAADSKSSQGIRMKI